jgi:hypothetical protein
VTFGHPGSINAVFEFFKVPVSKRNILFALTSLINKNKK